jgi:YVTN family beta-propeller protein
MANRTVLVLLLLALSRPPAGAAPAGGTSRAKLYVLNSLSDDMVVIEVGSNRILRTVTVGKEPHGIASPAAQDLVYVSNEGENSLTVVDTRTDEVTAKYPGLGKRPNEIEITSAGPLGSGFLSSWESCRTRWAAM